MALLSPLPQDETLHYHSQIDDLQSKIDDLNSENQRLKNCLMELEQLISEATPLLWVYQAPSFKRALDAARDWEAKALQTAQSLDNMDL
jgi:hypothetical protein